jgi:hypothetical protein
MSETGPTGTSEPIDPTGPTGTSEQIEGTGPTGTSEPIEGTGPTGTSEPIEGTGPTGPTGRDHSIFDLFPSVATGPTEPPNIITLDELMQSYDVTLAKEALDRQMLNSLIHPTREDYRPQLFQWASSGFTPMYIVQFFDITPPNICSDGVSRDIMAYLQFLLTPYTLDSILDSIRALMPGIGLSFSFLGNTLRIHVSKA